MAKKRKKPLGSLWKLSMKDKINSEKAQEGYSDVSYEDTWSVDETLANIIAKHLQAFLKAIKKSPYSGFPGEFADKYGHEQGFKEWCNVLRKMIYAFEEYTRKPYLDVYTDEEATAEDIRKADEEEAKRQVRIKEGMQLFVDHFHELWW